MDDLGEFTKQKSVVSQRLPIPRTGQRVPQLCQELRLIALPSTLSKRSEVFCHKGYGSYQLSAETKSEETCQLA